MHRVDSRSETVKIFDSRDYPRGQLRAGPTADLIAARRWWRFESGEAALTAGPERRWVNGQVLRANAGTRDSLASAVPPPAGSSPFGRRDDERFQTHVAKPKRSGSARALL